MIHWFIDLFFHWFIDLLIHWFIDSLSYWFIQLPRYFFLYSFISTLTYSFCAVWSILLSLLLHYSLFGFQYFSPLFQYPLPSSPNSSPKKWTNCLINEKPEMFILRQSHNASTHIYLAISCSFNDVSLIYKIMILI